MAATPDGDICDLSVLSLGDGDVPAELRRERPSPPRLVPPAAKGAKSACPTGLKVAARVEAELDASLKSLSQFEIGEEPQSLDDDERPSAGKDKGWDLHVEDPAAKKQSQSGRKWWRPRLGGSPARKPAELAEETTEVCAFQGLTSPGDKDRGWDLQVEAVGPGSRPRPQVGIAPSAPAIDTEVCTFEEPLDTP